jgi:hypothetical protein
VNSFGCKSKVLADSQAFQELGRRPRAQDVGQTVSFQVWWQLNNHLKDFGAVWSIVRRLTVANDWQKAFSEFTERILVEFRAEESDIVFSRLCLQHEVRDYSLPAKHIIALCCPDVAVWQGAAGLSIRLFVPKLEQVRCQQETRLGSAVLMELQA